MNAQLDSMNQKIIKAHTLPAAVGTGSGGSVGVYSGGAEVQAVSGRIGAIEQSAGGNSGSADYDGTDAGISGGAESVNAWMDAKLHREMERIGKEERSHEL